MASVFWKLSMGPGARTVGFRTLDDVEKWLRQGLVLCHEDTAKGQGVRYVAPQRVGEFFYLCHGNTNGTGIRLLGQFTPGPITSAELPMANGESRPGYRGRRFRRLKDVVPEMDCCPFTGRARPWTPNYRSTFVQIPMDAMDDFEAEILRPYFDVGPDDDMFD
jgi:hypothetical protein